MKKFMGYFAAGAFIVSGILFLMGAVSGWNMEVIIELLKLLGCILFAFSLVLSGIYILSRVEE